VAGDARALIGSTTDDQIVSVRARPVAYAASSTGQERWVGLMARYRDDQNYYYLTLRSGNSLSLRKLVNGVPTIIATVPATVTLGTWYSLRLEVTGNQLRAWLNDALLIQATDSTHTRGRSGLVTAKAAADFDDYLAYQP
jgi:pectate lyase